MAWKYLLIKEISSGDSDSLGFVACQHNMHPDDLESIDDIFSAPWEQGGDSKSVRILVKKATTEQGDEYQFVRDYLLVARPVSLPEENDGVFHRTLRDECEEHDIRLKSLRFVIAEFDRDSYKERLIYNPVYELWIPHSMSHQRREEIKAADIPPVFQRENYIDQERHRQFLLHDCIRLPQMAAIGVGCSYTFTDMSVGGTVTVSCPCGEKTDITDYEAW